MSTSEEVSLELLILDGSNYTSWSACMLDIFRAMGPPIEQIVDVSISPPSDNLDYYLDVSISPPSDKLEKIIEEWAFIAISPL